jgi:hypothetical protein
LGLFGFIPFIAVMTWGFLDFFSFMIAPLQAIFLFVLVVGLVALIGVLLVVVSLRPGFLKLCARFIFDLLTRLPRFGGGLGLKRQGVYQSIDDYCTNFRYLSKHWKITSACFGLFALKTSFEWISAFIVVLSITWGQVVFSNILGQVVPVTVPFLVTAVAVVMSGAFNMIPLPIPGMLGLTDVSLGGLIGSYLNATYGYLLLDRWGQGVGAAIAVVFRLCGFFLIITLGISWFYLHSLWKTWREEKDPLPDEDFGGAE